MVLLSPSHNTTCVDITEEDEDVIILKHKLSTSRPMDTDGVYEDREAQMDDNDAEDWEAELGDGVQDPTVEIKDWKTLHMQIKTNLKKHLKTLLHSQLN